MSFEVRNKFIIRSLIISGVCLFIAAIVLLDHFFVNKLNIKLASCEQEQELLTETFNNKLDKLNKQVAFLKEENRNIKIYNQDLESKLEELKYTQYNISQQLDQISKLKSDLEKNHVSEANSLQRKVSSLRKENSDLHALIKELQLQIQNYKVNSYGLFQAGKLEIELSNLEQQLNEQYENINQKKSSMIHLKDKCGTLRTNSRFCKEYDIALNSVELLEKQLEHLQGKREDLKSRINIYLSSSVQTNRN